MRLQSDITVNYALNRTGVKVTTKMTKTDSSYNTYKYAGLPIGPIACVPQKTMVQSQTTHHLIIYSSLRRKMGLSSIQRHMKNIKKQ